MTAFLSPEWFSDLNERWAGGTVGPELEVDRHVVLEMRDAPAAGPHAVTLTLSRGRATVAPGDFLGAEVLLTLGYDDARSLVEGTLDSAAALRQGRIKVRGDVSALVPLTSWLQTLVGAAGGDDGANTAD